MGKIVSFSSFAYPRETVFDDEVPTLARPKKQFLTPAQKHEMEKAIKAAKGKKAKDAVRQDYEYDGHDGNADIIDTEPAIEPSNDV